MYYDEFSLSSYHSVELSTNFCTKIIPNSLALEKDAVLTI